MQIGIVGSFTVGDLADEAKVTLPDAVRKMPLSFDTDSFEGILVLTDDGEQIPLSTQMMLEMLLGAKLETLTIAVVKRQLGV